MRPQPVGQLGSGFEATDAVVLRINKAINRKLTDAAVLDGAKGVLHIISAELRRMNGVNMATALHRLVRGHVDGEASAEELNAHPTFKALIVRLTEQAQQALTEASMHGEADPAVTLPAQCASIVAWSLATLDLLDTFLMDVLRKLATPRLNEFKPYEVTNLLWAYSKMGTASEDLLRALADRLWTRQQCEFKAQCLSMAVWSFATARWRETELFNSIAEELSWQASVLRPQEISNTAWAFGKLKLGHAKLFEAISWATAEIIGMWRFKTQELVTTIWAFANLGIANINFFMKAAVSLLKRLEELSPSCAATVLWSYAQVDIDCPDLAPKLMDVATCCLENFPPEEIALLVQSAARLAPDQNSFFEACAKSFFVSSHISELSASGRYSLIEGFNTAVQAGGLARKVLEDFLSEQPTEIQKVFDEQEAMQFRGRPTSTSHTTSAGGDDVEVDMDPQDRGRQMNTMGDEIISASANVRRGSAPPAGLTHGAAIYGAAKAKPYAAAAPSLATGGAVCFKAKAFSCPAVAPSWSNEGGAVSSRSTPCPVHGNMVLLADSPQSAPQSSSAVRALNVSCLMEDEAHQMCPVQPGTLYLRATGQKWMPTPLRLRHGMLDLIVIAKPMVPGMPLPAVSPWQSSPHVLQPVAVIDDSNPFLAYPFCSNGNLKQYALQLKVAGCTISARRSAAIMREVIVGVEELLKRGSSPAGVVGSIMPSSLFVDENEHLRVLDYVNTGRQKRWQKLAVTMKWLSPEEAQDEPVDSHNLWHIISYRVGLLMYWMGTEDFPDTPPILRQDMPGSSLQNLPAYKHSGLIRNVVEECLRMGTSGSPTRNILLPVLDALIAGV
eukprot:TRINITY_DN17280_c0_g2_i1.p1 TRINITY_DN17280_c0_g2~~TRINITY_DN17280_c0_g2_i1.p1  ORF type:complete len:841 (-),score=121.18 TRINITY_DN17280_c0_g2_i1:48-2570(-)